MAKPLKVDDVWLDRIAGLLSDIEFGSLNIVIHEGQIVQVERTERKRYESGASGGARVSAGSKHSPRALRESGPGR
ncbi:YezD family protein [Paenibacillus sp. YPG26]|uniref:YezD family protein n=1 Tax=Paenibacillus sp. YPG26 TaxID=2878915 RepID=UPI00203EE535|nr:YezD family protein [Paenibacillus sp. YPG26]USB33719.1 YezD family protein [Paenibacillus sp. YPG26]